MPLKTASSESPGVSWWHLCLASLFSGALVGAVVFVLDFLVDGRAVQLSTSWLLGERALKTALSMTLGSVSCALVSRKNWWEYMGGVPAGVLANTRERPMLVLAFLSPLCGVCFGLLGRLGFVRAGRADGIDQRN